MTDYQYPTGTGQAGAAGQGLGGVSVKTSSYPAVSGDTGTWLVFNSATPVTLTLPASSPSTKWLIGVVNIGAGVLTVNPNGNLLDNTTHNFVYGQFGGTIIVTDGTNYFGATGRGPALDSVAYTAVPVFDASKGNVIEMTLTGDVTSSSVTNAVVGQTLIFVLIQDGTGSHQFTWPTNFVNQMQISEQPGAVSVQNFTYDGNQWNGDGNAMALQGNAIASVVLSTGQDGYVLTWNGTAKQWYAASLSVIGNANASEIRGKNVASSVGSAGSGQDGYALEWVNANNDFELVNPVPKAQSVALVTASLANGAIQTDASGGAQVLAMTKLCTLFRVVASCKCRITLYATAAARTADQTGPRPNTVPPTPGTQHGVLVDLYLDTADKLTWMMSPPAIVYNNNSPQVTTIYYAVTNLDTTQAVTVTLSYVPEES